jgi:hypothetical protein
VTASTINTSVKNQAGGDAFKYSKFASAKLIAGTKASFAFSAPCTEAECKDYATNKIIITNKESK